MFHRRHTILLAFCFVYIIGFSAFTPLERVVDMESTLVQRIENSHCLSAVDYSALWNMTYGGFDSDRLLDLVLCENGGYALVGHTDSFNSTDRDTWVIRTDELGEVQWTKNLGYSGTIDQGNSIYECENGDFVIAGFYTTPGGTNGFVVRVNSNGQLLWTYELGLAAFAESFNEVIESSSGAIIAIGATDYWGAGLDDVIVVSLSPTGSPVWMRTYGGVDDDIGRSIVESREGGYALLADTYTYGAGNSDLWLVRLDSNGNPLWNATYGGALGDRGYDIIEYYPGGYVMAGQTRSFGDAQGDFYVVRADSDGSLVWDEFYVGSGEDFATGIIEAYRGGFTVVGISDYIGGNPQTRIIRIQHDSTEDWSYWYGGPNVDYGYELVEVYPEEYVVGGTSRTYGAGNFDGWMFLVPGPPRLLDPPDDRFLEFGDAFGISLWAESSAPIHMWWLDDTSVFSIAKIGDNEGTVYPHSTPNVGVYEMWVHVNNTAGQETEHIFWIYIDDRTSPTWTVYQEEHTVEFGELFQYSLNADDLSDLSTWTLEGSTAFDVDGNGQVSSVVPPAVGDYYFTVTVDDVWGNDLTGDFHVRVQDATAPVWDEAPQDQIIDYGSQFVYDLNASDLAGISSWQVDNTEFSVDSVGRVRNLITLAPGDHAVTVSVSDIYGNVLSTRFTVTVGSIPTTQPSGQLGIFDSAILFGAGVVATVAVAALVCAMGRRKPASSK